jgi:two-component system, sensor histidine kinase and response regulator
MPYTLLVVEDDIDVRENLAEILSSNSYAVITSSNGREAVKTLLKESPDLIISDIMMPVMNGYELLQFVQSSKELAHIPFVFLTAKTSNEQARIGMLKGADDYLTKPFKVSELLDVVKVKLRKAAHIKNQLSEIKENIVLSIPHELRSPLSPIIGLSGMMAEGAQKFTPKEVEEMSSNILSSALRLKTSVEKFILYSSLQYELNNLKNKKSPKENIVTKIEDMVHDAVAEEKKYIEKTVGIETDIEPCVIKINEAYFAVCLKELVENAFKFSDLDTKVKIHGKKDSGYYELSFENKGAWLTCNQIKNINLLTKHIAPTMPGSGLGIPIVKKIIEYFDGEVKVESALRKSTTVKIKLPTVNDNN